MEELKARITTQFKLLDLAERETEKINARNRNEIEIESKIERHLTRKEETENDKDMKYEVLEFMVSNEEQL